MESVLLVISWFLAGYLGAASLGFDVFNNPNTSMDRYTSKDIPFIISFVIFGWVSMIIAVLVAVTNFLRGRAIGFKFR